MNSDGSLLTTVTESTFQYKINNVSKMRSSVASSPVIVQSLPWNILVRPIYDLQIGKQPLGFFITCDGNGDKDWTCQADVEFCLYHSKKNRKPFSRKFSHIFCAGDNMKGFENFLLWQEVIEDSNGYLKDGSITFEVCIMPELPKDSQKADFSITEVVSRHTLKNVLSIKESLTLGPFTACNLPWKIIVKPPSRKLPENPHSLGLYLQCNKEVLSDSWVCNALVELRLLPQKKNQTKLYRIQQHRFSGRNNTSGIDDLILWKDLVNKDKGFIESDSITVEAYVTPDKFDSQAYLNVQQATFWYSFENVSKVTVPRLSTSCMIRNLSWRIKILPNKIKEGLLVSSLGCYLYCCEGYKTNKSWKCNAIAEIRLIPCKDNQKPYIRKLLPHHYDAQHNNWGFDSFIPWKDLLNPDKGYIKNDCITLEACVKILDEPSETIVIP
ncbi:uncharacterized protein LOC103576239 isoform X1 [Microplitis demolitor]|uniref:uncharacterized protein LOC103576239 isoform X1 n=1 Tax=Microplitis demolitor TaxID=69319 RepID=UPI0004CC9CD3|nr:uncharacterized protein LOC103576239 isoform X1 [Microplitis demolitor]XP_053593606.1 uncharacterized protein LOC103576239 isoform X1 [Microplitis demolitor]